MWWRERRWRSLLDLIDGLPNASRLTDALMNDPVSAEEIALLPEKGGKWHPQVRDYDTTAILLSRLLVATQEVSRVLAAVHSGKKPGRGEPMPAPLTAVDAIRRDLLERAAHDLIRELGGG